ncbi:MAG: UMP kinase [Bacteroidales bacterium]
MAAYQRILLKLSGESLAGPSSHGINPAPLAQFAEQVAELHQLGVETGLVIGGGNIFRGVSGLQAGFDRVKGDYMGMLATVINGLALQSALLGLGIPARLFTSIRMEPAAEFWNRDLVIKALANKEICIFSGGTGNPFFTTDTTAALRAVETGAEVLLKGTRVDGVYTADPEKDPSATRFDQLTFDEALSRNLRIMDLTAFTLCRENNLPLIVFDMTTPGNLIRLVKGENIGTIIRK